MLKRLRHPIRSITEPFGKAGLAAAVLAFVLALTGAAFAAGALTSKQKKEVEKIAKRFAGKPGAPGANGTNGQNGSPGPEGKQGPEGKAGPEGKEGKQGKEGSPWTAGGTLPSGKTETGTWSTASPPQIPLANAPISFPVPLEVGLGASHVFYIYPPGAHAAKCTELSGGEKEECEAAVKVEEGAQENDCPGAAVAPEAASGDLCVYAATTEPGHLGPFGGPTGPIGGAIDKPDAGELNAVIGAGSTGAVLFLEAPGENAAFGWGTWAVTAP